MRQVDAGIHLPPMAGVAHLRAFAAVWVLAYHVTHVVHRYLTHDGPLVIDGWLRVDAPWLAWVIEGHGAVGLFMVLSGYLFARAAHGAEVLAGAFYRNRLLRTAPLFVLLLAAGAAIHPQQVSLAAIVQHLLALGNYPGAFDGGPFTALAWAVAVEWQFYLLFPLLHAIGRRSGWTVVLWAIAAALVLRGLAVWQGAEARDLAYFSLLGRIDQFLLGMLAGAWRARHGPLRHALPGSLLVALTAVLVYLALHRAGGWWWSHPIKVLWCTVEGMLWAGLIVCYVDRPWLGGAPGLVAEAVGRMSYSIYLLHMPVLLGSLAWLDRTAPGNPFAVAWQHGLLVVLPLTLAISWITYHGIERPFLGLRGPYLRALPA